MNKRAFIFQNSSEPLLGVTLVKVDLTGPHFLHYIGIVVGLDSDYNYQVVLYSIRNYFIISYYYWHRSQYLAAMKTTRSYDIFEYVGPFSFENV